MYFDGMKLVLFVFTFIFMVTVNAQIPYRYTDEVFDSVAETKDVVFSADVPQTRPNFFNPVLLFGGLPMDVLEYSTTIVTLGMDIFEPEGDVIQNRPLITFCFGGGFVQGHKRYWSIRLLAKEGARRGFVVASIDDRLGMNLYDQDLGARSV